MQQLFFVGWDELGIVSELFKYLLVHLKRLRKPWLWWEQFCQTGENDVNMFFFNEPEQGKNILAIVLLSFKKFTLLF